MSSGLYPDILCLAIVVKYQRILVQDVTSEPGKYPLLSCLFKLALGVLVGYNKRIQVALQSHY